MKLFEFLKTLFTSEPLGKPVVQKDILQKETPASLDEEEELIAVEIANEDEDLFI